MGLIYLNIVDDKGKDVLIKDLTSTGLQMLRWELNQMQSKIDEVKIWLTWQ